jgi:hypothetical protein
MELDYGRNRKEGNYAKRNGRKVVEVALHQGRTP